MFFYRHFEKIGGVGRRGRERERKQGRQGRERRGVEGGEGSRGEGSVRDGREEKRKLILKEKGKRITCMWKYF